MVIFDLPSLQFLECFQLLNNDGNWGLFTKQRYYSDLGDPFQSVGEPNAPKKIKNEEEPEFTYDEEGNASVVIDDPEGIDKDSGKEFCPDCGQDLSKADSDSTESFRFSLGTTF